MGIECLVSALFQAVIRERFPCAGCKIIAECIAPDRKRSRGKIGGKNHQCAGEQRSCLTCNQGFPSSEDISDNTGREFKAEAHHVKNAFDHTDLQKGKSTER